MTPGISDKRTQGRVYEQQAEDYLNDRGYITVRRNYFYRQYEIDLVMLSPEKILVFVEVKYRSKHHRNNFHPWESVSKKKQQNLFRAAAGFLSEHLDFSQHFCRYDVVIITSSNPGKTSIEHFPEAFRERS